jgi:signal transduction histidine kinase/DNA-binding response OmpR family regulator
MPKKQLYNRLDRLFSEIDEHQSTVPDAFFNPATGWTWECDVDGIYSMCSPEVEQCLGTDSAQFINKCLYDYGVHPESGDRLRELFVGSRPSVNAQVLFQSGSQWTSIQLTATKLPAQNGDKASWRGCCEMIVPGEEINTQPEPTQPPVRLQSAPAPHTTSSELPLAEAGFESKSSPFSSKTKQEPWTQAARQSLETNAQTIQLPRHDSPAALAIPFEYGLEGKGVLEILDESGARRSWNEEERLLVQEVANQLALALENARLYETVQLELAERKRAEAEILRRNQDLAALNQVGQELSRLARPKDILDILQKTINRLVDGKNLVVALFDPSHKALYYPIFIRGGQMQANPDLATTGAIVQIILQHRTPLVINGNVREVFATKGLELSDRVPNAMLAIPMIAGDRSIGVIVLENFESDDAFNSIHLELLSTVASQATIALENAKLFGEIRSALTSIENRERHQSGVAHAVASLTETGSRALPEVLETLGGSTRTDRVYYAQLIESEAGLQWSSAATWTSPELSSRVDSAHQQSLMVDQCPCILKAFEEKGWVSGNFNDFPEPERGYLKSQGIRSTLMIAVPGKHKTPGYIAFEQMNSNRRWQNDEISILQVATDALANTILRESLLAQLQVSLKETENLLSETASLYEVSTGIAQASTSNDLIELLSKKALPAGAEQAAIINIYHSADGEPLELELVGFSDSDSPIWRPDMRLPVSALPVITTISSDKLVFPDVENSTLDRKSIKTLLQYQARSACLIPLRSAGRLTGLLIIAASHPVEFDPKDIHVLEIAASSFAVALERQRLLEEARRRAMELQAAAEVARDTTSTLSLEILLERIVKQVITRFRYYHASIFLKEETGNYAVIKESTGEAGQILKDRGFKLAVGSNSIIGQVLATGKTITVNDAGRSDIYLPMPLLPDTRSEMGLPLKLGDRMLGVLDIQSTETNSFTNDDIAVLQILADQIAVAIDNARSYELVQQAVEDMREVDRMKSQFLANMSHELRTPLNSIIGFSRVIIKGIDGPINEIQEQDLTAIYNSGQHLLNLINDVLDLSKIEAGKMELSFSDLDLPDMVRSVMSTAAGLVKDKPVSLSYSIPDDLPILHADSTRIRQVLLNFISNAAKFTDEGSIVIEAGLTTSPFGHPEVIVTVTDTGPGIAEEDRHKLFQPFSQVDDSPTRKTGGTGLGLSICRSLIDMHRGRIGLLSSDIGKGSTFFFALPLRATDNRSIMNLPTNLPLSVLCIDDDMQVISLYERYLKPRGYQVVPVIDPKRAVEFARAVKPVVITLDVMMPEKDGWQILQDLKDDPETRHIPIVMCTILEQEDKGFSLGASDYLVKPFLQEDLIYAIDRLTLYSQNCKILVIDDSPDDLRLVKKILQEHGQYQVILAEGGDKGWEILSTTKPDVIILDLFMPDPNGFILLHRLQNDPQLCEIPVIVLTGADLNAQQYDEIMRSGQELLTKGSFKEKDLIHALQAALNENPKGS